MKKKALTVVLTLTMAATMFAGCGDKKTTGTTETTEAVSTEDEKDDQTKAWNVTTSYSKSALPVKTKKE